MVTFAAETPIIAALSGTTALLLLCVFTVVNVALRGAATRSDGQGRLQAPTWVPFVGGAACLFLVGPWAAIPSLHPVQDRRRPPWPRVILWALTWLTNRGIRAQKTGFRDIEHMGE